MPADPIEHVTDKPRQPPLHHARLAFAEGAYDKALDAVGKARDAGIKPPKCLDLELRCLVKLDQTARAYESSKAGLARGETLTQAGYKHRLDILRWPVPHSPKACHKRPSNLRMLR